MGDRCAPIGLGGLLLVAGLWLGVNAVSGVRADDPAGADAPPVPPNEVEDWLPAISDDPSAVSFEDHARPVLEWYCIDCHDAGLHKGGVDLSGFVDAESVVRDYRLWEKVIGQLESRTMPPIEADKPHEVTRQRLAGYLRYVLDSYEGDGTPDPGPSVARRLTHAEYDNTVRDLTGVDLKPAATFPADGGGGEGFTNNATTLFVSPLLMEKYLDAAQHIVDHAEVSFVHGLVFHGEPVGPRDRERWREDGEEQFNQARLKHLTDLGVMRDDADLLREYLPAVYRYEHAKLSDRDLSPEQYAGANGLNPLFMKDLVAFLNADHDGAFGEMIQRWRQVPLPTGGRPIEEQLEQAAPAVEAIAMKVADNEKETARFFADTETKRAAILQGSGWQMNRLVFGMNDDEVRDALPENEQRAFQRRRDEAWLRVNATDEQQRQHAARVLEGFAKRAYRRPLRDGELDGLLAFYDTERQRTTSFETAVKQTLRRVLVSPYFLYRVERPVEGGTPGRVSSVELASRLSYLLWSSMPDEELMRAAEEGRLGDDEELRRQVLRMLADDKARAFATQFVMQWFELEPVRRHEGPDRGTFPAYDDALRDAMVREVELFVGALIREDRPVTGLVAGDFTFVNRKLAGVYGIGGVAFAEGDDAFVRVDTAGSPRTGVLGMGAVHLKTSYPHRSSPVLRGAWVLSVLLGGSTPPPPPNVGDLPEGEGVAELSLRERLAVHRADPSCAVCHDRLDPLGFSMQRFDTIGRYHERDGHGRAIDDSAQTPDGASFAGASGLRDYLLANREAFYRQAATKLMGYAMGREVMYYDRPVVRRVQQQLMEDDRFSTLVLGVVMSEPFRTKRGEGQE